MANRKPIPFIVIVQTPVYGTLTWGPFTTREDAESFMGGDLKDHLYATYETIMPPGMAAWVQPLYEPRFDSNGGE